MQTKFKKLFQLFIISSLIGQFLNLLSPKNSSSVSPESGMNIHRCKVWYFLLFKNQFLRSLYILIPNLIGRPEVAATTSSKIKIELSDPIFRRPENPPNVGHK